jgi:hypothetical protein
MGTGDEKVLSQADVDALVALVPDAPRTAAAVAEPEPVVASAPPPPPPAPKVVAASAPAPAAAAEPAVKISTFASKSPAGAPPAHNPSSVSAQSLSEVIALKKTVEDLTKQMAKFNAITTRLDQLEDRIGQVSLAIQNTSHNIEPSLEKIPALEAQLVKIPLLEAELAELAENIRPPHELRDDFVCEKCQSHRTMAILTKCTSCGQEKWFGWWPRKKGR